MSVARRFVEAIEWTVANEVLQMCRNRPKHMIIYTYDAGPDAVPLAMVSKYEDDLTDDQFKLRIWDPDIGWEFCTPIFSTIVQTASYIAHCISPEPSGETGVGVRFYFNSPPPAAMVPIERLRQTSTAVSWLAQSQTMLADYLDELGDPSWDDEDARKLWMEDEDHFEEMFEDEINYLITRNF